MVKIWHNPRCRKSRETLQLLRDNGIEPEIIEYLKTPPSGEEIKAVLKLLALGPKDVMRRGEKLYKELGLAGVEDQNQLVKIMADNPILIERPIVITEKSAAIGRPPENVLKLF